MLKIGDFSRLSRVSVRMLRHYDQLGLLRPSQTDPLTNYRYYSADLLPRLNRIIALRELGFSLEQIGAALEDNLTIEQLLGMLKLKHAEVRQLMRAEELKLARLEARIRQIDSTTGSGMYDVIVRDIGAEWAATYRESAVDDNRIQSMFEEVERYVATYDGARADRPPFTIYYDPEYRETDIDAEVAVPLKFAIPDGEAVRIRQMPGITNAACVVHRGDYATVYQAYNALLGWIESNGYRMTGQIREVYLQYGADDLGFELPPTHLADDPAGYVTELQLPIEKE